MEKELICAWCKKDLKHCRCNCPDVIEKEFNLKEKRKELKDRLIGMGFYLGDIENILKIVEEQDKEFIRLLKHKLITIEPELFDEIDKLSGFEDDKRI